MYTKTQVQILSIYHPSIDNGYSYFMSQNRSLWSPFLNPLVFLVKNVTFLIFVFIFTDINCFIGKIQLIKSDCMKYFHNLTHCDISLHLLINSTPSLRHVINNFIGLINNGNCYIQVSSSLIASNRFSCQHSWMYVSFI